MRVLVVGSGAREHALAEALLADPDVTAVTAAPGNPGVAASGAPCHAVDPVDGAAVVALARRVGADLVVIGPEAPLVAGVADAVRAAGIDCFGVSAAAARLEASKSWAKEVMAAAGVPTAAAVVCADVAEVAAALAAADPRTPFVVKADGLAAGKGVVVTGDVEAARAHAVAVLDAGGRVLVEEFLDGPEVSLFFLADGRTVRALPPAQDSKRLGDGDTGPNTGGMGAYAPLRWAPADLVGEATRTVAEPVVAELARRGTPYVGLLYVGLALTARGPRVVEFNVRFGDPEAQVVLPLLAEPLGGLLLAAATGDLQSAAPVTVSNGCAVTVVVAVPGYPQAPRVGGRVAGVPDAAAVPGVRVLHAGTGAAPDGALLATGGRVLSVTAVGADLRRARSRAYDAVGRITLDGRQVRSDIAAAAVAERIVLPVPA